MREWDAGEEVGGDLGTDNRELGTGMKMGEAVR